MELHYSIHKGLKPNLVDKMHGIRASEDVTAVDFCLTSPGSFRMLSDIELARIFGLLIHKLAAGRVVKLYFPYDVKGVKKRLMKHNIKTEDKWLWLDATSPLDLVPVLEAAAFTTFFAQVDGQQKLPKKPADLFNNVNQHYFLAVFNLYDESMEILSTVLSADSIINVSHEVGREEKIQVVARIEKVR